jgi:uncharacterized membrane protein
VHFLTPLSESHINTHVLLCILLYYMLDNRLYNQNACVQKRTIYLFTEKLRHKSNNKKLLINKTNETDAIKHLNLNCKNKKEESDKPFHKESATDVANRANKETAVVNSKQSIPCDNLGLNILLVYCT